uniref:TNFR-Cys domain-containing protein n=1 Tax=Nothobranchius furzeri TaxID=105023 RepID=A0A8C6L8S9_NOTFU
VRRLPLKVLLESAGRRREKEAETWQWVETNTLWLYVVGLGLLTRQRCSATSDSVCGVLDGFFCRTRSETGCSLAEKHSACQHGQRIKQPGTSRNDTVCEDCPGGSFSPDGVKTRRFRSEIHFILLHFYFKQISQTEPSCFSSSTSCFILKVISDMVITVN